jgi:polar amino acid transport system substrate-binding protein
MLLKSTAVLISIAFLAITGCNTPTNLVSKPSVYQRVIKANKLRCGYIVYPPGSFKDPNTGKLSGIAVESLEEAGKNLGMTVEWVEEVSWGSMIEGLETDRYDLIGSAVWANSTRGKLVDFSLPLFYSPIMAYTRANEKRFDGSIATANNSSVKIATIDGEMSDIISRSEFNNATRVSLPQNADVSQALLNVEQKKADLSFVEPYVADKFLQNNPGTLRRVTTDKPLRIFGNCYVFRRGQGEFKQMLNTAIDELENSGFVDRLVSKYAPGSVLMPAPPYDGSSMKK